VIWIETPRHVRLERGLERNGAAALEQWRQWMAAEDQHYDRDPSKERADRVVDGAPGTDQQEDLEGGWQTAVRRDGDTIRRQPSPWSPAVINFLDHLENKGFVGSPRTIGSGFDEDGNEKLEYLPGRSPHPAPWTDQGITELGQMIASFHQAARDYQPPPDPDWKPWHGREVGDPTLGFGHGDLGPWNIMAINGSPVGFIDWDTAGPLDPVGELAQAAWLNVQLHDDDVATLAALGTPEHRVHQLALLVNAYGLTPEDRIDFVDKMVEVAVREAATQAREHSVTPDTAAGIAPDGYPFAWGMAWRIRAASWMLQHRALL